MSTPEPAIDARAGRLDGHAWPAPSPEGPPRLTLAALGGRLVELTAPGGTALLTAASALVLEAQRRGEPAAWVSAGSSVVYPPDLDASGIDLAALPIVRVRGAVTAARAADELLRSGGFALVVVDLAGGDARGTGSTIPLPMQTRLSGLAHKHHAALVCLTRKSDATPSLGSLVSLRARGDVWRAGFDRFTWSLDVVKDKRTGPGWRHEAERRGPDGLV